MQVPEHVISLYVATCGQNGPGLGSDEKEVILLVYVVIEAATGQIVGTKQLLVRPVGTLMKDRTVSTSSETSNSAASPPLNSGSASSSMTINTINEFNGNSTSISINNNNNNRNAIAVNSSNNTTSNGPINIINNNNNNNSANTNNTSLAPSDTSNQIELPIAVAQAAGKPLNEAIEEFDEYLRSLSLAEVDFKLVIDGQLPLRQCLHREACVKDIELPSYYNRFCDLRKEFQQFRAGDLSRALVPLKDIKKMLQIPGQPLPQSIAEMMKDLNLTSAEEMGFYVRESRDMASVVQAMIKGGHKFTANEIVNLALEPGICSIDDEIDGNCIVRARGLPWQSSDQDIAKFFRGLNVAKGGVALCLSPLGRRNGEALVRFISQEHRDMALKRHKHHIGNRYIEVYRATGEDFLAIAGGASNEAQAFLSKGAQVIIRMRGLPYDCNAKQVLDFFTTGEKPCNVLDGVEGVLFVKKPDGRATGDAFVLFSNETDAPKALSRHRESIGQRYIELFRSTTAEVQQVLNRSMDPKTYEPSHQPPLIAQLPTMLLPQHLITSGTTKNCIRLRGLPYEALVEHILHFLDDFAKHIIYQGVHMVINAQGQPSGEAFIQMDSEESARICAQRKHNQFMVFGKKYRYIEVFQCSGDDMNMVLNGGLQTPVNPHHVQISGPVKQTPLLSPGASLIGSPFGPFAAFGPATPLLASPHRTHPHHAPLPHAHPHPHPHPHAHPAAFYPAQLLYWPYPSPPVSPTTYYSQAAHSPTHVAPPHQTLYPVDFLPAAAPPTNYAAQAAPMSPPTIAITTATTTGLMLTTSSAQVLQTGLPKQYPTLPVPSTTPTLTLPSLPAAAAVTYQTKLHQQPSISPAATPLPATKSYINHNNNSNSNNLSPVRASAPSAATQVPLIIDTSSGGGSKCILKSLGSVVAPTSTTAATAVIGGAGPSAATDINSLASNLSAGPTDAAAATMAANSIGTQSLMKQNQCVELYSS